MDTKIIANKIHEEDLRNNTIDEIGPKFKINDEVYINNGNYGKVEEVLYKNGSYLYNISYTTKDSKITIISDTELKEDVITISHLHKFSENTLTLRAD